MQFLNALAPAFEFRLGTTTTFRVGDRLAILGAELTAEPLRAAATHPQEARDGHDDHKRDDHRHDTYVHPHLPPTRERNLTK